MTDCSSYITKEVSFKFRGVDYGFALSQGLFSSAGIDSGTRFLLRVFSNWLDGLLRDGRPLPRSVLDAGCGVGVIGICAGRALADAGAGVRVRAQDRDELGRAFTEFNARRNGFEALDAYTEPLLGGEPDSRWDLILSNVPAKAGASVLEDFIARSAGLLNPGGRVFVVVVNTLAAFFREQIGSLGLELAHDETGPGHTVFAYRTGDRAPTGNARREAASWGPVLLGEGFPAGYPAYFRGGGEYEMEGIGYHIDAVQGAAGFDNPGGAVRAAAKLTARLWKGGLDGLLSQGVTLVHEPDQGHFPVWLAAFLRREAGTEWGAETTIQRVVLSGRNILALAAAKHNLRGGLPPGKSDRRSADQMPADQRSMCQSPEVRILPAVDLMTHREELRSAVRAAMDALTGPSGDEPKADGPLVHFITIFPDLVPMTRRLDAYWEGLDGLLAGGGIALIALPSSEAEQFDRKKMKGFSRIGDIKREGFRALAYRKQ